MTPVGVKIDTVDIRPKSLGIVAKISPAKDAVSFTLSRPAKLSIEFNGNLHRTLHLFADAIDPNPPKPGDPTVRYFGPGVHNVGELQIADRQTVYIAGGAYVNGQLIAAGKKGVRIAGRGILTGRAYDRDKGGSHCNIELNNCASPVVDGIICLDPPGWSFNVYHSSGVLIQDVKYIGARANSDGISLQSCDGATVRDCFVRGWDDNLVVKNYEGDTHRIQLRDCILWTDLAQSVEIGYETRGGVMEDIAVSNIQVLHNFHKPVLSIHNGDRAAIRNVRYENITVEDAADGPGRRREPPDRPLDRPLAVDPGCPAGNDRGRELQEHRGQRRQRPDVADLGGGRFAHGPRRLDREPHDPRPQGPVARRRQVRHERLHRAAELQVASAPRRTTRAAGCLRHAVRWRRSPPPGE